VQVLWLTLVALPIGVAALVVWRHPLAAFYAFLLGLAFHNAAMAALYGAGLRGVPLTFSQAWKEILLFVALARVGFDASRSRALPFRPRTVDVLALVFSVFVICYSLIPQNALGGSADLHGIVLGARHNLVAIGAYFLGRSLVTGAEQVRSLLWTLAIGAAAVAAIGLADMAFISIGWWRDSAVPKYFQHLGFDYHGTGVSQNGSGGLPENFIYSTGSEKEFYRRLVSVFLSPLATAYMLTLALLAIAAGGSLARRRRLVVAIAGVSALALLYTFSRSALLVLAGALIVLALVQRRRRLIAIGVATVVLALVWAAVFPHVAPSGHWTQADLALQREIAAEKGVSHASQVTLGDASTESHWASLRAGVRTVIHHPQGYGVGNVGQVASRTGVEIKAGESNYTEMGAEMGVGGALSWIAWNLTLLAALFLAARRSADPARRHFAALCTAFLAAALALSVQTDVIGDPWMAYVVWGFAGLALASRAENGRQKTASPGATRRD